MTKYSSNWGTYKVDRNGYSIAGRLLSDGVVKAAIQIAYVLASGVLTLRLVFFGT
jgi:hypothetical protein